MSTLGRRTGQTLSCGHCNEQVYIPPNRIPKFKYCSRKCMAAAALIRNVISCIVCETKFHVIHTRANSAKYCSEKCYHRGQLGKGTVKIQCAECGNSLLTSPSRKRTYCSQRCKNSATHKKWPRNLTLAYAKDRLRQLGEMDKCHRCGFSEVPEVLQIHHEDRNRRNNSRENLIPLCPTCHSVEHYKAKDGPFHSRV